MSETLIIGHGLIGAAVADRLRSVITVSRGSGHLRCDLSTSDGLAALRTELRRIRPRCVVLTHGPSDVTWIEGHEAEAEAVHRGTAELLAGLPTVLISTDNVFPGDEGGRTPAHPVRPGNAYGRVKLAAERALRASGLVLRVSLVYGWSGSEHRANYGQRCLESALRNEVLRAPTDQSFTPVHVDDVARVVAALCLAPSLPVGVAHLSGPEEITRFDFARAAYRLAGADPDLVRPCLRQDTEWASRPRYSSLACTNFDDVPGLAGWRPMSPEDGLKAMLAGVSHE